MKPCLSLHIGVNFIDSRCYDKAFYSRLCGAVNDAMAMEGIAIDNGFHVLDRLTDRDATFANVEREIRRAVNVIKENNGGIFFLTYSGHGARLLTTGREEDQYDEGFVLHDLIMKDNYIDVFLRSFPPTARVIFVADCCHSRTIHGINSPHRRCPSGYTPDDAGVEDCKRNKRLDCDLSGDHGQDQRWRYQKLDQRFRAEGQTKAGTILADGVLLSACDDNERAADGRDNGLFTRCLLDVLRNGGEPTGTPFTGTYQKFIDAIARRTGNSQVPQFTPFGLNAGDLGYPFFQGPPFSLHPL